MHCFHGALGAKSSTNPKLKTLSPRALDWSSNVELWGAEASAWRLSKLRGNPATDSKGGCTRDARRELYILVRPLQLVLSIVFLNERPSYVKHQRPLTREAQNRAYRFNIAAQEEPSGDPESAGTVYSGLLPSNPAFLLLLLLCDLLVTWVALLSLWPCLWSSDQDGPGPLEAWVLQLDWRGIHVLKATDCAFSSLKTWEISQSEWEIAIPLSNSPISSIWEPRNLGFLLASGVRAFNSSWKI